MMTLATGKAKGLTFIEIIFVIIIVGVLVGVSTPSFKKTFNNLQLNSVAQELQTFMNYLNQRAVIEGKVISLNIDDSGHEYWAKIKDAPIRLRSYAVPKNIGIETEKKQILFYPDGRIDQVTIKLATADKQNIILTTKGIYGKVKLQIQQ